MDKHEGHLKSSSKSPYASVILLAIVCASCLPIKKDGLSDADDFYSKNWQNLGDNAIRQYCADDMQTCLQERNAHSARVQWMVLYEDCRLNSTAKSCADLAGDAIKQYHSGKAEVIVDIRYFCTKGVPSACETAKKHDEYEAAKKKEVEITAIKMAEAERKQQAIADAHKAAELERQKQSEIGWHFLASNEVYYLSQVRFMGKCLANRIS